MRDQRSIEMVTIAFIAMMSLMLFLLDINRHPIVSNKTAPRSPSTLMATYKAMDIVSPEEFAQALKQGRLILHIDVDWSATAIQSRLALQRSIAVLERETKLDPSLIRRVDCTEQQGPLWDAFQEWLSKEVNNAPNLQDVEWGGAGTLILLRSGQVIDSIRCPAIEDTESVVARLRRFLTQTEVKG